MAKSKLKAGNRVALEEPVVNALRIDFAGEVIAPGDADYDQARRVWNTGIDKYPALIARCTGTADVMLAIGFAHDNALPVSVRSGGHNVAGKAVCDDGLVIDLSKMTGVVVDPVQRTVQVRAGTLLAEIDRELYAYGLAIPAGVYSGTGIAGLMLGGGIGWLMRKYGLSCDNLVSAEVVTADGRLLTASDSSNADLFWALRGGGHGCGVVTSFQFRAHPVRMVLAGPILYPQDQARAMLRHYRDFITTVPDELTVFAGMLTMPDGTSVAAVVPCYCGPDLAEGERAIEPLRDFQPPLLDAVQPLPFPVMQKMFDANVVGGSHNFWKSALLQELSDAAIDVLVDAASKRSPLSLVIVQFFGGAVDRVRDPGPAAAMRQKKFNVNIEAQWIDPAETERHVAWARQTWTALQPHATGGLVPNFTSDGDGDRRGAPDATQSRLAGIIRKYDPDRLFSVNRT